MVYYRILNIVPCAVVLTFLFFLFFCLFAFSRAAPMAHGGSQGRGLIGAVAASLHHSHSNARSKPRLWPTPQHTATPDPQPTEQARDGTCILMDTSRVCNPLSHKGTSIFHIFFLSFSFFFFIFIFFVFLPFLGPLPQHMEVPRLGVGSEL